jgi:phosphoglycolate phosphatase
VKDRLKNLLSKLSFRTGVIILISCVVFYILSFVQAFLPLSTSTKGVLFIVFFGLAKTTQYTGLAIVGVQGWQRIKAYIRLKRKKS